MVGLKAFKSLKKNEEFTHTYNKGKKWHCKCAVVFYIKNLDKKVGFVASKKIGNAIRRAKAKRRLRAIFLELQDKIESGIYVFIAKKDINLSSHKQCLKDITWSLKKMESLP